MHVGMYETKSTVKIPLPSMGRQSVEHMEFELDKKYNPSNHDENDGDSQELKSNAIRPHW